MKDYETEMILRRKKQATMILTIIAVTAAVVFLAVCAMYASMQRAVEEKYRLEVDNLLAELTEARNAIARFEQISTEVNISVIDAQVKSIGELATVEYLYTDAGKFSDARQLFGRNIPFTTKSFVAKWDGSIKAGVDVEKVQVELDEGNKNITVYMPNAEILSHEVDEASLETLDESSGLFNPISTSDAWSLNAESKQAMEQRAIEAGLLEKAAENAKDMIAGLICADDAVADENYTIVFEVLG